MDNQNKIYEGVRILTTNGLLKGRFGKTSVTVNGIELISFFPADRFGFVKNNYRKGDMPITEEMIDKERSTFVQSTLFEWGFEGASPLNLAVSILIDFFGQSDFPSETAYYFMEDVVKNLPHNEWRLTSDEIAEWLYKFFEIDNVDSQQETEQEDSELSQVDYS